MRSGFPPRSTMKSLTSSIFACYTDSVILEDFGIAATFSPNELKQDRKVLVFVGLGDTVDKWHPAMVGFSALPL